MGVTLSTPLVVKNFNLLSISALLNIWTQFYKQNSSLEFDSMQELTNQISHLTNLGISDRSIPAKRQILC